MISLSDYEAQAALCQARLLDAGGSAELDVERAGLLAVTEGRFSPSTLRAGLTALTEMGLVSIDGSMFRVTEALVAIARLDDETAIILLRKRWEQRKDRSDGQFPMQEERILLGALGEECVLRAARNELSDAGQRELAEQVQRVSLIDDSLGYDVQAPTLDRRLRLMEVKTSSVGATIGVFRFFISRNEYEVGVKSSDCWAIVACQARDARSVDTTELLGWSRVGALKPYLPEDGNGHWTEAMVRMPKSVLIPGLPPAI